MKKNGTILLYLGFILIIITVIFNIILRVNLFRNFFGILAWIGNWMMFIGVILLTLSKKNDAS